MGNLGRAAYGASLDGMWPYSYDSCDVGTLANQTQNDLPLAAIQNGDPYHGDVLSYLPGQRLSACTCPGEDHPGPTKPDGTLTGRSAPEIDIFEAIVNPSSLEGFVSQSCQWAPYNAGYKIHNTTGPAYTIEDSNITAFNHYVGGVYQQVTSALAKTNQSCYTANNGCFTTYGYEYKPGNDGYVTWFNNAQRAWTLNSAALEPDPLTEIQRRPVPQEPMVCSEVVSRLAASNIFLVYYHESWYESELWPCKSTLLQYHAKLIHIVVFVRSTSSTWFSRPSCLSTTSACTSHQIRTT